MTNTETMERPTGTAEIARQMETHAPERADQNNSQYEPLLPRETNSRLQSEWNEIQAGFVDEPRQAVQKADELVAFAIKQIAETFARERSTLESQWDREGEVSTEDLRVALTRYRSFFHRLLSM